MDKRKRILITCPPMLNSLKTNKQLISKHIDEIEFICPEVKQTLERKTLEKILTNCDGWIIGDDFADRSLLKTASENGLEAIIKWGIGIDNIDVNACKDFKIKFINTPGMFNNEVADLAIGYLIALAREFVAIDRGVRSGHWPKNQGISLENKCIGLIGYGDIGKNFSLKCRALGMQINVYDPAITNITDSSMNLYKWPNNIQECDFIVLTCSLNKNNVHMISDKLLKSCKNGVRIINVSRGQLIDEKALIDNLETGQVHSVALDVFEEEPLNLNSELAQHPLNILGTHNASNTYEAVMKTNELCIKLVREYLEI